MPDTGNRALIVVDMQRDFLSKGGYYDRKAELTKRGLNPMEATKKLADTPAGGATEELRELHIWPSMETRIANMCGVIERARAAHVPIAYVQSLYGRRFDDKPRFLIDHPHRRNHPCRPNTRGAEFIDCIQQFVDNRDGRDEAVIEKHVFDAFFKTELTCFLQEREIKTVYIVGVETHICILSTAQSASLNGFNSVILEDCVATERMDLSEAALNIFRDGYGLTQFAAEAFPSK